MKKFIFTTTGLASTVRFEEIGAYFDHPISAYTLTDSFEIEEVVVATTIQDALDNGEITAVDGNGNVVTNLNYLNTPTVVFSAENISSTVTYVGYGEISACKIQKVITTGSNYTAFWSSGNESFDKIWVDRATYSYF